MTHVARTTDKDFYETPPDLWDAVNDIFRFDFDAAASAWNAKCDSYSVNFLTKGIIENRRIWMNPPFSQKAQFLERLVSLAPFNQICVAIIPNNARESKWRVNFALAADEIINLVPRVNYCIGEKPVKGVPFSSALLVYRGDIDVRIPPREFYWNWKVNQILSGHNA